MYHQTIAAADWTNDRRARVILASISRQMPNVAAIPALERWTIQDERFVGYRVECLQRIRDECGAAILAACEASDDYRAFTAFCDEPSVQQAVEGAVRIPRLAPIATSAAELDPSAWDAAKFGLAA